jgi:hypothetical protein
MTLADPGHTSLCFESTRSAATSFIAALQRCLNAGLRLPSTAELAAVQRWLLITSPSLDEEDWSDEATGGSTHFSIHIVSSPPSLAFIEHLDSDSVGSRCVTTPHNNLGASPTSAAARRSSIRTRMQVKIVARSSARVRKGH